MDADEPMANPRHETYCRESMAGDVWFHPDLARTVCVDIRYVMWIIDKYAEADWLLDEMKFEK